MSHLSSSRRLLLLSGKSLGVLQGSSSSSGRFRGRGRPCLCRFRPRAMGNLCSSCCNPNRNGSLGNRKPLEKPLTDLSPVFPTDGTSLHISLTKRDSSGSSPYNLIHQVTSQASRTCSTPFTPVSLDPCLSAVSPSSVAAAMKGERKSFVSRIPPLGPLGRSGSSEFKGASEAKVLGLFARFKDHSEDAILTEGIETLCAELELKPEEFKVLIFAWKCNVDQMCRFSRSEFLHGCRSLKADSLRAIQQRLPEAVADIQTNPDLFKDLYRFTYRFGLEPGQKVLPVDMAVSLWQLVFSMREPPLLGRWLRFLQGHPDIRGVPRDTWNMFLNLTETVGDDLSQYDDAEAWPSLFDDFVEFENDKANQNVSKSDMCGRREKM